MKGFIDWIYAVIILSVLVIVGVLIMNQLGLLNAASWNQMP